MSTDQIDPDFVDNRGSKEVDPHGIVPDGFLSRYGTTSVREALQRAEADATRTNVDEMPRCPECLSTRITNKPGSKSMAHKRPEKYKCSGCGEHFDEPAPSREEMRPGKQATLREVSSR